MKRLLMRLGHFQAALLLSLLFFLVITPYGLLLRGCGKSKTFAPGWQPIVAEKITLANLRRSF